MVVYADTSFLFSLYANDANTVQAHILGQSLKSPIAFTLLQQNELRNALRLSVFRKDLSEAQCRSVLALIDSDMQSGVLAETQIVWTKAYARAEILSQSYTPVLGCRAADILHVAIAETLEIRNFYTFDERQKRVAHAEGFKVFPVKSPA
jgi:predicted nucleic acid-binding protein